LHSHSVWAAVLLRYPNVRSSRRRARGVILATTTTTTTIITTTRRETGGNQKSLEKMGMQAAHK
jgi:hypothetical protein